MKKRAIYVAGAYSSGTTMGTLLNIRRAIQWGNEIMKAGHAPLVPHLDFQMIINLQGRYIPEVKDLQEIAMAWLEKADAVFVVPDSEDSTGTQKEILRAMELNIPVHNKLEALLTEMTIMELKDQPKAA